VRFSVISKRIVYEEITHAIKGWLIKENWEISILF